MPIIPPQEHFDLVDASDQPTGQVLSRNIAYAQKARFRIAHVYLFNADFSQVYLQQRSATKSFAPLAWSATVVGHVSAGESWLQGAAREMQEELSLDIPIAFIGAFDWLDLTAQHNFMNGVLWGVLPDNTAINLAADEVANVKAVPITQISDWLKADKAQHPAFASTWLFLEKNLPHLQPKTMA